MNDPDPAPPGALDLPEMKAALLDRAALERVFLDLAFETSVLGILIRGGTTERAQAPSPSLGTAREVLLAGEATGLQIHYIHRGVEWWGTLMHTEQGVRMVRVRK